jgi:glycerol-3-phosphate acyltransferase PlsX
MRIAVDAMGGDNAPREIVKGALAAAQSDKNLEIILVGREDRVGQGVSTLPDNVSVVHAAEVIENEDKPLMAIRRKRNASMVVALQMLKEGQVDAVVSAGNTGALMAGASLLVGRIPGVNKPALAPVFPTEDGRGVVAVDIGAAMDPRPENLYQYAIMGNLYYKAVFGTERPRVGLLNIGVEPEKGNELVKETYKKLAASELNFIGNVEARDVLQGQCDVLICDGFVGNVLLKSMEGVVQSVFSGIKAGIRRGGMRAKIGALLLKPTLKAYKDQLDYSEHGGAPLLGINGVCVKCHGSADANTVKNSILKQAYLLVESQAIATLVKIMEE